MFPIRDHNPAQSIPFVTYGIIGINLSVFVFGFLSPSPMHEQPQFYDAWAVIPVRVASGSDLHGLVTSLFLHGGWLHLLGNMLFLFIFGDNLEDSLGHAGFTLFYLLAGVCAGLAQVLSDPTSPIPLIGASGAIAGVMGGYLLLFPKARIDLLFFFVVIVRIAPVPAWAMLAIWFGFQVVNGLRVTVETGGVAYWAHAGGFIAGAVLMLPVWLAKGGPAFWTRTHGHPDHPHRRSFRQPKAQGRSTGPWPDPESDPDRDMPTALTRIPRVPRRR